MRVDKINFPANFKFKKFNCLKANKLNFKADSFEKNPSKDKNKQDIIKYSVDWGWNNFDFMDSDFTAYFPEQRKLNILNSDEQNLKHIAESLCMYSDDDIKNFASIFYPMRFGKNEAKSQAAYKKIQPYIASQRQKLSDLLKVKSELEATAKKTNLDEVEVTTLKIINEEIDRISQKCENAKKEYLKSEQYEVSDDNHDEEPFY